MDYTDDDQGNNAEIVYENGDQVQAETDAAREDEHPPDADADTDFDAGAEDVKNAEAEEPQETRPEYPNPSWYPM